ncbi:ABC transporter permease [Butyrivibrio sp. AE2032]|uniref:ABC transporter permease n=1 Tax=Butyrivibrio sp. AE2032 TaxID=1458463 RepID=UPI0005572838|nr:ABC transporter permease [Butyrivibrio sp. AE2032]
MNKTLLLTKSNLRKNRGTSVGLFLLMLITTCLIGIALLIFMDCYPSVSREAVRLNGGDGYLSISGNIEGFTDEKIKELLEEDTDRYYTYHDLKLSNHPVKFGNGEVVISLDISDDSAFTRPMNTFEVITEDTSITENYIYLPYQFNTAGGFNTGDVFEIENSGKKYSYTVRGFTNVVYGGCNNTALFALVVDNGSYKELWDETHEEYENINIIYDLKDGVKNGEFRIRSFNELLKVNPFAVTEGYDIDGVISNRTFIGLIIAVSFLVATSLIIAAVAMMLANSISNYIKENMKTLGALKAIGYTGKDIKASLVIWFLIIAALASIIGIVLSYIVMPVFASIIIGQMGVPYSITFNLLATLIPVGFVVLFTLLVTVICANKVSKIQPIVALREGVESHNFRKNHVALSKSSLSVNASLAMKTFFGNMKQNVITFFVLGFMVFCCVISLLLYENFSRHPKLDILATEICAGVVTSDQETREEVLEYLENRSDIKNIREIINMNVYYDDQESLFCYIVKDLSKMNNTTLCYKGRLPEYDNEIAVSGSFARAYGFEIGDEIKIDYGDNAFNYLITGFIQTANNQGREAIFSYKAADHIMDIDSIPGWYWFDLTNESEDVDENIDEVNRILEECEDKYGIHIVSTMNFYKMIGGAMTTFQGISLMMLVVMCSISVVVIALILFLLIKSLVYHKRKDYGIYKALGYTSGSLMLQTAMSFMPSVIASAIVFSVVSYNVANPYISLFMRSFGLMKCDFAIPVPGVVAIGAGLTVVSFFLALLQTRRIRKIEAYNMLVAE